MTKEEKKILFVDLCARLPYTPVTQNTDLTRVITNRFLTIVSLHKMLLGDIKIKPYLRPMSSMTKEELKEYYIIAGIGNPVVWNKPQPDWHFSLNGLDWLYQHHFDVRGLIPMGLAIEAPADMYL